MKAIQTGLRPAIAAVLLLTLAALALLNAGQAGAENTFPHPRFWDACDADEPAGEQCGFKGGVEANPENGHLYVGSGGGDRIIELSAWGEFLRTFGWDVVASGPGDTPADEFEVCVPADGDACKNSVAGDGPGQFDGPRALALDSAGDLYVVDVANERVQKFDLSGPEPAFEWMAGAGVNQGGGVPASPGDLCTAAHLVNGDLCGAGVEGTGPGQFSDWRVGDFIDVDTAGTATAADDSVWVGDKDRIQRLDTDGVYQSEIAVAGETIKDLGVDPDGDLYATYAIGTTVNGRPKPDVHKLDPGTGAGLGTLAVGEPYGIATDPDGVVYVVDDTHSGSLPFSKVQVHTFSSSGQALESFEDPLTDLGLRTVVGIAVNQVSAEEGVQPAIYLANNSQFGSPDYVRAYSPIPDTGLVGPPPLVAPTVSDPLSEVGVSDATIGAAVNPHFWDDATWWAEYGDQGPCDANPCEQVAAAAPLDAGVVDSDVRVEIALPDLEPDTTYHFRFAAQSSGGGPAIGSGGSFTTFAKDPAPRTDCPNQGFRTGPSARLPDCRAYEMVSPIDKGGGEILAGPPGEQAHFNAAPDGSGLTYGASFPFAGALAAPYANTYLAARDPESGWSTKALDAPRQKELLTSSAARLMGRFEGFSEDLSQGWMIHDADPQPDPGGVGGYLNLYRRDNLTDTYTPITTVTPPVTPPSSSSSGGNYLPRLHGFTDDGTHAVFTANDRLLATASAATDSNGVRIRQLYEWREGAGLRVVSVLPGGGASDEASRIGAGRTYSTNAISEDGSVIWWTSGAWSREEFPRPTNPDQLRASEIGDARLYARIDGAETVAVSASVADAGAHYWTAAADGSAALFTIAEGSVPEQGNLYRFDLDSETPTLIAGGVEGVAGASEDLSHIYLISTEVLDPVPNPIGEVAEAGKLNLFHFEQGEGFDFIGGLGEQGAEKASQQFDAKSLYFVGSTNTLDTRTVRVSPDGRHLVFVSRERLSGYDNRDAGTGRPLSEVFLYSADEHELDCVSCDPSGQRSRGLELTPYPNADNIDVGGLVPQSRQGPFHVQRYLSDDGSRLFFESFHDILPRDNNGKGDVYEWQRPGTGDCSTEHPHYFEASGGCLHLISTGRSADDSHFIEATPDGETVFIRTTQSLLPQDPGAYDIYAARVGGGIPTPQAPVPCEGDGCQPPAEDPEPATPGSEGFEGAEDPAVPADCRRPAERAQKAAKGAKRAKRKAKRAKRRARRAKGKPKARRLKSKAKGARRAAKRAKRKARKLERKAGACASAAIQAELKGAGR